MSCYENRTDFGFYEHSSSKTQVAVQLYAMGLARKEARKCKIPERRVPTS